MLSVGATVLPVVSKVCAAVVTGWPVGSEGTCIELAEVDGARVGEGAVRSAMAAMVATGGEKGVKEVAG